MPSHIRPLKKNKGTFSTCKGHILQVCGAGEFHEISCTWKFVVFCCLQRHSYIIFYSVEASDRSHKRMGSVCMMSRYPKFNGSHFGLPPSSAKWLAEWQVCVNYGISVDAPFNAKVSNAKKFVFCFVHFWLQSGVCKKKKVLNYYACNGVVCSMLCVWLQMEGAVLSALGRACFRGQGWRLVYVLSEEVRIDRGCVNKMWSQ